MVLDFGNSLFAQRDVRETATSLLSVSDVLAPVGAVMPWLKNLTGTPGLPVGWVECNGQTISDAASVYNGTAIPDLNGGNRFLRGNSTSGTTGGTDTQTASGTTSTHAGHTHDTDISTGTSPYLSSGSSAGASMDSQKQFQISSLTTATVSRRKTESDGSHSHTFSDTFDNKPLYYNIVFIMRIK